MDEEVKCCLALGRIPGIGPVGAHRLIDAAGSAAAVFARRHELAALVPGMPENLAELLDCPAIFGQVEEEMEFAARNRIRCLTPASPDYPDRLRRCPAAPLALFYRGTARLDAPRVVGIVGTRRATPYGQALCERFVEELAARFPDVLVVSGLAYGIDIHAHRAALRSRLATVGVLAHGLDRIYPAAHRATAVEMLEQGGLLTEYPSRTPPERQHFIQRNRIVAGMSDAVVVVESAHRGGALATARLAQQYGRPCFAFPGRVDDEFSAGCNELIRSGQATLIADAAQFLDSMGWSATGRALAVQRELFPDLSEDDRRVVCALQETAAGMQVNRLAAETGIPVGRLSVLLFDMEMRGILRAQAGGVYRLLD